MGGKIVNTNVRICPDNALDKALWPLLAGGNHKFFSFIFGFFFVAQVVKNMSR